MKIVDRQIAYQTDDDDADDDDIGITLRIYKLESCYVRMQIMQIWSVICLSLTRTCRALARVAQQCNNICGCEWLQHCWAT